MRPAGASTDRVGHLRDRPSACTTVGSGMACHDADSSGACSVRGTSVSTAWREAQTRSERVLSVPLVGMSRLGTTRGMHRMNRRLSSIARKDRASAYALNHARGMRRTPLLSDWFSSGEAAIFEGRTYPVPSATGFLTALYGSDFMTPPPPEQQRGHEYGSFWAEYGGESYGTSSHPVES